MAKKRVFLLQDTKEENRKITECFLENDEIEIIGSSTDGITAITEIAELKPDVVITGLVLSGYDGIQVISKIKEMGMQTKIMVLSALSSEEAISKSSDVGADYFLVKPFEKDVLVETVKRLIENKLKKGSDNLRSPTIGEKVSKIFINVGIPPHIKGYTFLREGVIMTVNNPEVINNITKKLYPSIGEKYNTTPSKVERAIRHAIEVAWNRGRIEAINNILGVRAYVGQEKPTNGEFIALVADRMMLEKDYQNK